MSVSAGQSGKTGMVDVKVTIPEMADIRPFWLRDYPLHATFAELYQDCINHEDVRRSRQSLERISHHFWFGERFLPRSVSLASQLTSEGQSYGELSLVLRLTPDKSLASHSLWPPTPSGRPGKRQRP